MHISALMAVNDFTFIFEPSGATEPFPD